ncbi:MAG TPA: hypothetical protein VJW93_01260 [Candidatus Acidoferrales bacterium]|nr:hypothetical protein [Candidatus Acidoferrales bacterium]
MRRTLTALLIVLLLAPEVPARGNRGWQNVKKLKPDTPVLISLWSGENLRGLIDNVSDTGLRLAVPDRTNSQVSWERTVDRATIHKIVRLRDLPNLPDRHKWMVAGAVAGATLGVTTGAISDAKEGYQGGWIIGGLAGGLFGAMAGNVAAGLVGIGEATPALLRRRKVVYEDSGPRPSPQSH